MAFATVNPYTNELVKSFESATREEIVAAIEKADNAFQSWKKLPVSERVVFLQNATDLLRKNVDKYAGIIPLKWVKPSRKQKAKLNYPHKF